jgi:hypothetical protein
MHKKFCLGNLEGKRTSGFLAGRWQGNIKKIRCENVD